MTLMFYFLKKTSFPQFLKAVAGNLASSFWFLPSVVIWLHRLRGVGIADPSRVFIGRDVIIDNRFPEKISIGPDVWICAYSVILSHSYFSEYQCSALGMEEKTGTVTIGEGAFIGARCVITPGVNIGKGAYIAAGSVVVNDVPEHAMVAGNPAAVIRTMEKKR